MVAYIIVAGFILFDIITGICKALYNGNFNSSVMREGGFHKASEILAVVGATLIEYSTRYISLGVEVPVVNVVVVYICVMEIISIIENLAAINPELEKLFNPYLEKLKDKE